MEIEVLRTGQSVSTTYNIFGDNLNNVLAKEHFISKFQKQHIHSFLVFIISYVFWKSQEKKYHFSFCLAGSSASACHQQARDHSKENQAFCNDSCKHTVRNNTISSPRKRDCLYACYFPKSHIRKLTLQCPTDYQCMTTEDGVHPKEENLTDERETTSTKTQWKHLPKVCQDPFIHNDVNYYCLYSGLCISQGLICQQWQIAMTTYISLEVYGLLFLVEV